MFNFISNITDKFKAKDFHLTANKKIKSLKADFKKNFGLTLRVYKGKQLADEKLTLAALNQRTSKDVKSLNEDIKIKVSMTIGEFEKLIDSHYGLTVQVANEHDTYCINNKYTLGQASRKEDFIDDIKNRGFESIEDWLKHKKCKDLDEYYSKNK
jgi:hypothetical protein